MKAWEGFNLICPSFAAGDGFYLEGVEGSSLISSTFEFNINRCTNKTGIVCKSPEEIKKFINDIQIDVWHMQENMDF